MSASTTVPRPPPSVIADGHAVVADGHAVVKAKPGGIRLPHPTQSLANTISLGGAALCVMAGVLLAIGAPIVYAAVLFPVGAGCDLLDGLIARRSLFKRPTLGAFTDSICDKLGEVALALGLFVATDDYVVRLLIMCSYGLGALTSYTKAAAGEHRIHMDWPEARIFGRAGRAVLTSITLATAAVFTRHQSYVLLAGFAVLTCFNLATFGWRFLRVLRAVRPQEYV